MVGRHPLQGALSLVALFLLRLALVFSLFCVAAAQRTQEFPRQRADTPLSLEETRERLAKLSKQAILKSVARQRTSPRRLAEQGLDAAFVAAWQHDTDDAVQQVTVAPGARGEATITWVSFQRGLPSTVFYGLAGTDELKRAEGRVRVYTTQICLPNSVVMKDPVLGPPDVGFDFRELATRVNTSAFLPRSSDSWRYLRPGGDPWEIIEKTNFCIDYKDPLAYYTSPYIHTVVVGGLKGRSTYTYRPAGSSRSFSFRTPADPGAAPTTPFRLGVWADVGVTNVSFSVMKEMLDLQPELLLTVGDLAYADGWAERWDVYGTMMEPLFSSRFQLVVPGNHEMVQNNGVDMTHRYPMPYSQSDSESPFMFSHDSGGVHVLGLPGSYAETHHSSAQWAYAAQDLERVDRVLTPWVVVMFHTPWYSSNGVHYGEGLKHKADMEALFYKYGVDLVFTGHVHSYERSHPVHNDRLDPCGATHIVIGDAGNYEGPAIYEGHPKGWREPQPDWSAFREASFGGGLLEIQNATHATWEWRRVACASANMKAGNVSETTGTKAGKYSYEGSRQSLGRIHPSTKFFWDGMSGPADGPACSTDGDSSDQRYSPVDRATLVRDPHSCPNKALRIDRATARASRGNGRAGGRGGSPPRGLPVAEAGALEAGLTITGLPQAPRSGYAPVLDSSHLLAGLVGAALGASLVVSTLWLTQQPAVSSCRCRRRCRRGSGTEEHLSLSRVLLQQGRELGPHAHCWLVA